VVAGVRTYFVASSGNWLASPVLDRLVARVASQYSLTVDDLPDLVQETRIALWELGLDLPVSASLVLRIASNKAIDLVRRRVRRRTRDRVAALAALPREEDAELRLLLDVQVEALPDRLRRFYELHYNQGLSERETARTLGICRASVRWLDRQLRRLMAG
jgi:RNA polymerase sigma factor (sigma-70 family)